MEQRFYELVTRILSGAITSNEKKEFEELILSNKELKDIYDLLFSKNEEQKDNTEAMQAYTAHYAKMQLLGLFEESETKKSKTNSYRRYLTATIMIFFLVTSSIFITKKLHFWNDESAIYKNEIVTKKGSQSYVKLPDGTKVWLNGDSKLLYPDAFNKSSREVKLVGEAYFDVAKNPEWPFIIHTEITHVKVLGTAFNLRAYPDEANTETTLVRGTVEVTLDNHPGNKIQMHAGEKLSVTSNSTELDGKINNDKIIPPRRDSSVFLLSKTLLDSSKNVVLEVAWIENKLAFDADDFGKMISKISKWYNVDIEVGNSELYESKFTAIFENKSIDQVLSALQYTGKFKYKINGNKIKIY